MARIPYNSHIDLGNNEIQNAKFQMLASAPNASEAKFYYDTTLKKFGYYNGTEWVYGTVYTNGTGILINGNVISVDTSVIATVAALQGYVPTSREINGKPLTADIDLSASDVGALPDSTTINDLTTTAQQNALNSGATTAKINQITTNQTNISNIQGLIPAQASTSNQLADKDFVNSSISTNTADFDGSWDTYAAVPTTVAGFTNAGFPAPTNNNYLVVKEDETQDGGTWRYKYIDDGGAYAKSKWKAEYEVNETPFTQAQLDAINSGATSTNIGQIATNTSSISTINGQISTINTTLAGKTGKLTVPNPALTASGGVCTWSITNSFATNEVNVMIFRISDGVQVMTEIDAAASTIAVKFNSTSNIAANTYRAVIIG